MRMWIIGAWHWSHEQARSGNKDLFWSQELAIEPGLHRGTRYRGTIQGGICALISPRNNVGSAASV